MDWNDLSPTPPAAQPVDSGNAAPNWDDLQSSEDRYGTLGQQVKTAAEQFASGATLGLSKKFETATGIATPEDIKGREQENPWTSGVSNIAGAAAGLLGPDELLAPVKGVQLLGRGAEALLGGGKLAKIAGAGVEGAMFGGFNQAADDWSQNKPLDAEKIAASAGIGALFGGGGATLMEAPGLATKGLSYFDALKRDSNLEGTEGWFNHLRDAYSLEGTTNPDGFINNLSENLGALYKQGKQATEEMYEKAGNFHLTNALESIPVQEAQGVAVQTLDKIESLANSLSEDGAVVSNFESPTVTKVVAGKLETLKADLANAETSMDIHTALTDFATDLDKGLKFDKLPTASQQVDQEILQNIRQIIRGDLKSPELWKDAAPIYRKLSDNYSDYMIASKNFQRDFMKNRIGPNGKTIKVIDPSKIKAFFNNLKDPSQNLKHESLEKFIDAAFENGHYAENYDGFQKSMKGIVDELQKSTTNISENEWNSQTLKKLKIGSKGHEAGVGDLVLVEALSEILPKPVAAAAFALRRYMGEGGGSKAGMDLYQAVNGARKLAEHADVASKRIEKGAKAIFLGSSKRNED